MKNKNWKDKISNPQQLGGIELSVLDDGTARGSRIAWFNTGSGLRFKVVIDRALDIADAFYNQNSLAWISHLGVTAPNPCATSGLDWLNSFGGGLLTTCGLTHIGNPEKDENGECGLHDRISNIPASIESIIQPDLLDDEPQMSITGRVLHSTAVTGPHLELKRTISVRLGSPKITISDTVTNLGNTPAPHMLLYHFNFGYPLVDEGTDILWEGAWQSRGGAGNDFIFNENNYPALKKCLPPIKEHLGTGESVGYIDLEANPAGMCEVGLRNHQLGLEVKLSFPKKQLPWLINWQHFGKNEYMVGIEPATHTLLGRGAAIKNGTIILLQPGERRTYNLEFEVREKPE
jgi:hypothetical protein